MAARRLKMTAMLAEEESMSQPTPPIVRGSAPQQPTTPTASAPPGRDAIRDQLRGMDYATGAAYLRPDDSAGASGATEPEARAGRRALESAGKGSDVHLASLVSKAQQDIGHVSESPCKGVPPLFNRDYLPVLMDAFRKKQSAEAASLVAKVARLEPIGDDPTAKGRLEAARRELAAAQAAATNPEEAIKQATFWFASDAASLARLRSYARSAGLNYDFTWAAQAGYYSWCGSFVADFYQLGSATLTRTDPRTKALSRTTLSCRDALASTPKARDFFNYRGAWEAAYARVPGVPDERPVAERYRPIRAMHQAAGGERQWLPVGGWRDSPQAVVKPGMAIFVLGEKEYGAHIGMVGSVESTETGATIHTIEGNRPNAPSVGPGAWDVPKEGPTQVKAVARPSPLDLEEKVELIDQATYQQHLKNEPKAPRS